MAAGLRTGDAINAVDGRPVAYWEDLDHAVAGSAGRALQLTVSRGGDQRTIAVTPRRTTTRDPIFKEVREIWDLGAGPQLTPQIGGFIPGSAAERAGLRAGDLILEVGGQPVFTPEEITQAIQKRGGQPF
jgi:regulator of sigma E protease